MENIIRVGEGEAGWVITRSTLNRNGCFITSGLYDSSYHGTMAAVLHITFGTARIKKGTRIGQYLSFDAEMLHEYNGSYGFNKDGNPKKDEEKYHK
jgi:deoxycytidine triphosphate deaminase